MIDLSNPLEYVKYTMVLFCIMVMVLPILQVSCKRVDGISAYKTHFSSSIADSSGTVRRFDSDFALFAEVLGSNEARVGATRVVKKLVVSALLKD